MCIDEIRIPVEGNPLIMSSNGGGDIGLAMAILLLCFLVPIMLIEIFSSFFES